MITRATGVWIALFAVFLATPSLAQEPSPTPSPSDSPAPAASPTPAGAAVSSNRATPGRGGVGGLIGGSLFTSSDEYSKGALPRFDFSAQFRYIMRRSLRFQVSPGFTWSAYSKKEPPPFTDPAFPNDRTKEEYLTLLIPVSAQLQLVWGRSAWLYHVGAGPGVYRLWVENHRKVLVDPQTFRFHRGAYLGFTMEAGVERFLKALPNTTIEVSAASHSVFSTRDDQFPAGWNSPAGAIALRAGTNYYFDLNRPKKTPDLPVGIK